jgi:antitoxin PrlF
LTRPRSIALTSDRSWPRFRIESKRVFIGPHDHYRATVGSVLDGELGAAGVAAGDERSHRARKPSQHARLPERGADISSGQARQERVRRPEVPPTALTAQQAEEQLDAPETAQHDAAVRALALQAGMLTARALQHPCFILTTRGLERGGHRATAGGEHERFHYLKSISSANSWGRPMKEALTVVTRKGQVTIPAEVRRALNLRQGDKVAFALADEPAGQVVMRRVGSVVEQTAGAVQTHQPAPSARRLRQIAAEAIAKGAVERMDK